MLALNPEGSIYRKRPFSTRNIDRLGGEGEVVPALDSGTASPEPVAEEALQPSYMPHPVRHEGLEVEKSIVMAGVFPSP